MKIYKVEVEVKYLENLYIKARNEQSARTKANRYKGLLDDESKDILYLGCYEKDSEREILNVRKATNEEIVERMFTEDC